MSDNGATIVNGNFNYSGSGSGVANGKSGQDELDLSGTVFNGNVTLNLGNGDDQVALDNFTGTTVTVGGDATFILGNGDSSIQFNTPGSVGDTIRIRAGNGNKLLDFENVAATTTPVTYNLDVIYGNGDNTVTLNNANATLFYPTPEKSLASGELGGGGFTTIKRGDERDRHPARPGPPALRRGFAGCRPARPAPLTRRKTPCQVWPMSDTVPVVLRPSGCEIPHGP